MIEMVNNRHASSRFFSSSKHQDFPIHDPLPSYCTCFAKLILDPSSNFLRVWNVILIFLLLYIVIILPLRLAFSSEETIFDYIIDFLFAVDILLSFLTPYENRRGQTIKDPRLIARHYVKTWFPLDLISTIPVYLIVNSVGQIFFVLRFPKLVQILKAVRLLKLLRARRFKTFFEDVEYTSRFHPGWIRAFKLLFCLLCFGHFSGCIWFFIGVYYRQEYIDNFIGEVWIDRALNGVGISEESPSYQYLVSVYWALTTLTTVGFGDLTPQTTGEITWTMIIMIMGTTIFSYTTATLSSILSNSTRKATLFREKMQRLREFLNESNCTPETKKVCLKKMRRHWMTSISDGEDWHQLLKDIPSDLAHRCVLEKYITLIEGSPILCKIRDTAPQVMAELLISSENVFRVHNCTIIDIGDEVSAMYILVTGELHCIYSDGHVVPLGPGSVLGIDELCFGSRMMWPCTIVCHKSSNLLKITKACFNDLKSLDEWNDLVDVLDGSFDGDNAPKVRRFTLSQDYDFRSPEVKNIDRELHVIEDAVHVLSDRIEDINSRINLIIDLIRTERPSFAESISLFDEKEADTDLRYSGDEQNEEDEKNEDYVQDEIDVIVLRVDRATPVKKQQTESHSELSVISELEEYEDVNDVEEHHSDDSESSSVEDA